MCVCVLLFVFFLFGVCFVFFSSSSSSVFNSVYVHNCEGRCNQQSLRLIVFKYT